VNPDQALLKRYLAHPHTELAIDSNPLALALRAKFLGRDDGMIRIGFDPSREFLQGNGVVQGGIVAAMLDLTSAFASQRFGRGRRRRPRACRSRFRPLCAPGR